MRGVEILVCRFVTGVEIVGVEWSRFVTRKNRHNRESRVSRIENIDAILSNTSNYVVNVVTTKDNKRNEALRLVNQWNGINTNNIDNYLDQIRDLYNLTIKISTNLEYANGKDDVISFIKEEYAQNINKVIETYNAYLDINPFIALKYEKLNPIDFKGVLIV